MTVLRELDITGGEPYLVKDLPALFAGICASKHKNLKSLQSIAITTNSVIRSGDFISSSLLFKNR